MNYYSSEESQWAQWKISTAVSIRDALTFLLSKNIIKFLNMNSHGKIFK